MKHKGKTKLILAVILANLLFANFTFAQATPNLAEAKLDKQAWDAAQASKSACDAFSKKVADMMNPLGTYFAKFFPDRPEGNRCRIHMKAFGADEMAPGTEQLETLIKTSSGINQKTVMKNYQGAALSSATNIPATAISVGIGILLSPFTGLIDAIANAVASLTNTAGQILSITIAYTADVANREGPAFPAIVDIGWKIVRDVMNLIFILALIIMSLATILRVESYNYKKILFNLIMMALLINFSKAIAEAILLAVGTLTRVLAKETTLLVGYGTLYNGIMNEAWADLFKASGLAIAIQRLALAVVGLVTLMTLAVMFIIRMVGIWVLIILSPAAYALNVLPETKDLAKKWWKTFIGYVIWPPVALLFIGLANRMANPSSEDLIAFKGRSTMFAYLIITVFLWAAILVAKKAEMVGGDWVVKTAQKAALFPAKFGWKATKFAAEAGWNYGAEKLLEKKHIEIRPEKWIEGWKESRKINTGAREYAGKVGALEKGSAMASPTTFFQRYWGVNELGRALQGGDKKGHEYLAEAKALQDKAKEKTQTYEELRKRAEELEAESKKETGPEAVRKRFQAHDLRAQAASLEADSRDEVRKLLAEAKAKEEAGKKLLAPDDYFTQKEIRHGVNDEMKNIHTENWHELADFFDSAKREGKQARAAALLLKLTDTYNENELINRSRYHRDLNAHESAEWKDEKTKEQMIKKAMSEGVSAEDAKEGKFVAHKKDSFFTYSAEGAENFRKLVLGEELKMGEQGSMMIMSDVSDRAEERNHLNIMRMYGSEHGKLRFKGRSERIAEQSGEMDKMGDDKLTRNGNRLIFFDEVPDADFDVTGKRTSYITEAGLAYYVKNYQAVKNRVNRNEYNASQAMHAALPHNRDRIFALADSIKNKEERDQYLQVMSALVDYGHSKSSEEAGKSMADVVIETVREKDAKVGRKFPPSSGQTVPGGSRDPSSNPRYIPSDKRSYMKTK